MIGESSADNMDSLADKEEPVEGYCERSWEEIGEGRKGRRKGRRALYIGNRRETDDGGNFICQMAWLLQLRATCCA